MVTALCPLYKGVSQMNFPIAQTLCQNQTLDGLTHTTEVMAIFVIFLAYFGQNLVAMATSLRPCNQKCLLWIGRPRKSPVISNHILVTSRRNGFICIYSNFSPKIGCHGNTLCPLCTGVSWMNSPIAQTLSENQTMH